MAPKKKKYSWLPKNFREPEDGNWTHQVYADCDFEDMERCANLFDSSNDDDWRIELYGLIDQLAIRALQDRSRLDVVINIIGRHIRLIPRKWGALAVLGIRRLLDENDETIRQRLVDHANNWDSERQRDFYQQFAPDTREEEDPVLAAQVNLLELQEKYGFKPKFGIKG